MALLDNLNVMVMTWAQIQSLIAVHIGQPLCLLYLGRPVDEFQILGVGPEQDQLRARNGAYFADLHTTFVR